MTPIDVNGAYTNRLTFPELEEGLVIAQKLADHLLRSKETLVSRHAVC